MGLQMSTWWTNGRGGNFYGVTSYEPGRKTVEDGGDRIGSLDLISWSGNLALHAIKDLLSAVPVVLVLARSMRTTEGVASNRKRRLALRGIFTTLYNHYCTNKHFRYWQQITHSISSRRLVGSVAQYSLSDTSTPQKARDALDKILI